MKHNFATMSIVNIGKTFNTISNALGRNDLGEILYSWNESQLNDAGDKIIRYPGRDGIYSRGHDGGKINISKREFLSWLFSDGPFDEKIYGSDIKNVTNWSLLIQSARDSVLNIV